MHERLRLLREQTQADEDIANSKILKVQDSIHQFDNEDNDIKVYRLNGGDDRLAAAKKMVVELDTRIERMDDEIMQLSVAISETDSNIANMHSLERNVADNLRYREMQRDITRMKSAIAEMEKQNAQTEVDKYNERADKLRKDHNKWTAEVLPCVLG
jgi:DNA repair protein RAD50